MAAEPLDSVEVSWHGLVGDRRWAFIREGVERSNFPWLTIRERPEMWHYLPRFIDPDNPDSSALVVRTPDGTELDVTSSELAKELGFGSRVIKQNRGIFDTFPISIITKQTIQNLSRLVGEELDVQRFRPNLLVEATSDSKFPEDEWVGHNLQIGDAIIRVDKRDQRCAVVNVDPDSTLSNPDVLRTIAKQRSSLPWSLRNCRPTGSHFG